MNFTNIDQSAVDQLCHAYVEQDYEPPITWPEVADHAITGIGVAIVLGLFIYFMVKMVKSD